jgi:hypothetical protein
MSMTREWSERVGSLGPAAEPDLEDPMVQRKPVVVSVRLTPELKAAVDAAAERSGLGLMDWVRGVLARAANEGAFAPRKPRRGDR